MRVLICLNVCCHVVLIPVLFNDISKTFKSYLLFIYIYTTKEISKRHKSQCNSLCYA